MGARGAGRRLGGGSPGSLGWWLVHVVGTIILLGLMAVLAVALTMLTRMLVEGGTEPELHLPTFLVWFALCGGGLLWSIVREAWTELKDEQVYVTQAGHELRVDRWSSPYERQQFDAGVAVDKRARERDLDEHGRPRTTRPRPEPTSAELRAAALRRRETGPGLPPSTPVSDWSGRLWALRRVGLVCLYGALPLAIVAGVAMDALEVPIAREWGLLPFVLLPVGWVLLWAHHLLRHRWLRTPESRSELATFHCITALFGVVIFAVMGFTGLVMRDEAIGVALVSFPLMVLCIWVIRREIRHLSGRSGDASTDHTIHWDSSPDMSVSDVNPFD